MAEKTVKPKVVKTAIKTQPKTTPKKASKGGKEIILVEGVRTTKSKKAFAEEYALTGDKTQSLKKAGLWQDKRNSSRLLKTDDVTFQINLIRQQTRRIVSSDMDEVKQLLTELSMFSLLDVTEADGTFNVVNIKKRGLTRFIKEIEVEEKYDENGKKIVITKAKGHDRIAALKLLTVIKNDEENRDIQMVQALSFVFSNNPGLIREKQRVFNLFAQRYNVDADHIETVFDKVAHIYMVKEEKPE